MTLLVFCRFLVWFPHPTSFVWKMEEPSTMGIYWDELMRIIQVRNEFTVAVKRRNFLVRHPSLSSSWTISHHQDQVVLVSTSGFDSVCCDWKCQVSSASLWVLSPFLWNQVRDSSPSEKQFARTVSIRSTLDERVQELLADLRAWWIPFFGLETGVDPDILVMKKQVVLLLMWAFQMVAFVILSSANTSWRSVPFIWPRPRTGLSSNLLDAKVIERKKGAVTYLQRAEDIMDFLIVWLVFMQARDTLKGVKILWNSVTDLNRQ